ncbi:MAG: UPF0176 protein [Planctomycetota bacterium]|jgi:UPF0176 protein
MPDIEANIKDANKIVVMTMYKFVHLPDHIKLKAPLLEQCQKLDLFGTILLAEEGINGTIAGGKTSIEKIMSYLQKDERFEGMECKESRSDEVPFHRMKVKLKREIVSMGVSQVEPEIETGTRVKANDWNALIADPDMLLIDVRNQYETDIGSFKNAISPDSETFRDFPSYVDNKLDATKHKKVAMYCTGGIRCEKASAYLLQQGFEAVYQLDGGILRYLEEVQAEESLWQGECFVFDGRVAVNQALAPGMYTQCYACRRPLSPEQIATEEYEEGVSCPHCYNTLSLKKRAAVKERQRQVQLAEQREQRHIGASMPGKSS